MLPLVISVVSLIILVLGAIVSYKFVYKDTQEVFFSVLLGGVVALLLGFTLLIVDVFVLNLTTGFFDGYSEGERIGYFTKISRKGVIWKTWEAQIQVGTGKMAALQEPQPLSIINENLIQEIQENIGRKAKVQYTQWLIMPYHIGDSGYLVTGIEWMEEDE